MDIPRAPKRKTNRWVLAGIGVALLVLTTLGLGRLKPAAPSVERAGILVDQVKRGQMLREVRGPGTLVPEQIRWVSAVTAGRVEVVYVRPGATVQAGTELLRLSNPDVQLEALNAQQNLAAAMAQLVNLHTSLETQRLNQLSTVTTVQNQLREAQRNLESAQALAERNLGSTFDLQRTRDQVDELTQRLGIERQRLELYTTSVDSQLTLQRGQVDRLRAIADFQQNRVASMHVSAGADGVVQELSLEPGQWVQSGTTLARVVQPGHLKAVLRIPETQARDVALGQLAAIDTRIGIVPGRVVRIDPGSSNGTVAVDVALEGPLPQGARPDLSIEGTVEIERLSNILYVGRPAYGQQGSTVGLFKLVENGRYAIRVNVGLGRSSVNTIELLSGLAVGDSVILSDMSRWDDVERVRLR